MVINQEVNSLLGVHDDVEQSGDEIRLHLDQHVEELLQEYLAIDRRSPWPKKAPMQSGPCSI